MAAVLWRACPEVTLWASVDAEERHDLFTADAFTKRLDAIREARADPKLEIPLIALAELVAAPGAADPDRVSLACSHVSE